MASPPAPPPTPPAPPRPRSAPLARAFLAARLSTALSAKPGTVRPEVSDFLAGLLNAHVTPAIPAASDAAADAALLGALCGRGAVATPSTDWGAAPAAAAGDLSAALQGAGLEPPGVTLEERAALSGGCLCSSAVGAVAISLWRVAGPAAEAVLALSLEALGASLDAFDAEPYEAANQKAAAAVCSDARAAVAGSTLVNDKKGGVGSPSSVAGAPAALASLREAVAGAYPRVRSWIQSSPAAVPAAGSRALAQSLLGLSAEGLDVAGLALERAALGASRLAGLQPKAAGRRKEGEEGGGAPGGADLSGLASAAGDLVEAARGGVAGAAGGGASGAVAAAVAAVRAAAAAREALALEAMVAVASLRQLCGDQQRGDPPAAEDADDKAAKKAKKGKKGGVSMGKATGAALRELEAACAAAASDDVADLFLDLSLAGGKAGAMARALTRALSPEGDAAARLVAGHRDVLDSNQATRKPKIAKGARDFMPDQMSIREQAFAKITGVFKRHGAVSIDTPVFELRETLTGKYGEDSKLIYDLADQGGELLSLRYDLTVPFARYVALHGAGNIKRYHIAKVYRRDQPQMARGRFREFFQCDFDIAGSYPAMVPDAEVLSVMTEILTDLEIGPFEIKLSHRRLLSAMTQLAGVPPEKFKPVCSAIDKLDKEPWEAVRAELTEDKGVPGAVADKLWSFVQHRGDVRAMLDTLRDSEIASHPDGAAALEDLGTLAGFLDSFGCAHAIKLDLSLARGLEYYTGIIYEAVLLGANVGSIAAGGRYDGLVGMFSGKDVPAVGASIGIERVMTILEGLVRERAERGGVPVRETETEVLVASIGKGMQPRRMEVCAALWRAGIKAEFGYKANPQMPDQLGYALKAGIPLLVLFGESELSAGVVKIKDLAAQAEDTVPYDQLVPELKRRLGA